jgi:hypothetical protein
VVVPSYKATPSTIICGPIRGVAFPGGNNLVVFYKKKNIVAPSYKTTPSAIKKNVIKERWSLLRAQFSCILHSQCIWNCTGLIRNMTLKERELYTAILNYDAFICLPIPKFSFYKRLLLDILYIIFIVINYLSVGELWRLRHSVYLMSMWFQLNSFKFSLGKSLTIYTQG